MPRGGFSNVEVVTDLGSGLNYRKKCLQRILLDIQRGRVSRLAVVTKDRLLRFGSELLFQICRFFGVELVVLDVVADISREQHLTVELVELTVFSSWLYGFSQPQKPQGASHLMQATTQTRLHLNDEAEDVLQRYGQLYGSLNRYLPRVAAGGDKVMACKTEFCRAHCSWQKEMFA